uniref:hypothetical protein n=1 Tax=Nocardia wallacei TaxID=480035 RepID=UPI0024541C00
DTILKVITYQLNPAGLVTIYNKQFSSHETWRAALNGIGAALVGGGTSAHQPRRIGTCGMPSSMYSSPSGLNPCLVYMSIR